MISTLKDFFDNDKAGGITLLGCTMISLLAANIFPSYGLFWHNEIAGMNIIHWINDGLMAIFFLLVGLELKREFLAGELSRFKKASTPIMAALGGVMVPAGVYLVINQYGGNTRGVGIPMATDVVFALGVLSLLGNRVPLSIKVFLTALAVIDDLCAILIIALLYSQSIVLLDLSLGLGVLLILIIINRLKIKGLTLYLIGGAVMWYFMLHSGIHASITGVILAMVVPFEKDADVSPAQHLQLKIHRTVTFVILPLFALANTSIMLSSTAFPSLLGPVSTGIVAGLLFGKPLGIVAFSLLAVKLKLGSLPLAMKWEHIVGIGLLGGVGFTISIFMSVLAFQDQVLVDQSKLSVMIASFMSGALGYLYLARVLPVSARSEI